MGNCCGSDEVDTAQQERVEALKRGNKFTRKSWLSSQDLWVRLNENATAITWRTTGSVKSESGAVPLDKAAAAKPNGERGLLVCDQERKPLLEVVAEDGHSRDKWVTALNELLEKTRAPQAERVEQRPSAETKQALTSGVDEYWNKRHGDLVESRRQAEDKKKKYGNVGMKYTAEAMMKR